MLGRRLLVSSDTVSRHVDRVDVRSVVQACRTSNVVGVVAVGDLVVADRAAVLIIGLEGVGRCCAREGRRGQRSEWVLGGGDFGLSTLERGMGRRSFSQD